MKNQYVKGHFIGMGLAVGIPVGIPIGLALGNLAFGPLTGAIIGLAAGIILEIRLNKNPIKLDNESEAKRRKIYKIGFITGFLFLIGFAIIYLLIKSD